MYCKYLKIRSKNYKKYYYCSLKKSEVVLSKCAVCSLKEYKVANPLKTTSKKQRKAENKRYSIIYQDLLKCASCGSIQGHIDKNEVFEGRNRQNSMKYGMIVPLCRECHDRFHNDREFNLKWKRLFQEEFEKTNSREKFIEIFKINYLD